MDSKSLSSKVYYADQSSLWIEALVPGVEGISATDSIAFQFAGVARVQSFGPLNSIISIKDGPEIIFNLPYDKLQEKIRDCVNPVLNLKEYVNLSTKAVLAKKLREEFADAIEAEKWAYIESLTMTAYVRQSNSIEFRPFTFSGKDINARNLSEGGSIFEGTNIKMKMKGDKKTPFGDQEFLMEGSIEELRALCKEAHAAGKTTLDLSEYSRRKGTTLPPEKLLEVLARRSKPFQP
ncbi:MAG: hypothetical protein PW788_11405 [Micavibrio sp.]|nr:hypothetical protein [Micavibrio sp.]